jgi:hypothetical protein
MKKSEMSAAGSSEINGASRWLAAWPASGLGPRRSTAVAAATAPASNSKNMKLLPLILYLPWGSGVFARQGDPVR